MLIKHYLITRRKCVLIKNYALNKHVRLLTRLYSILCKLEKVPVIYLLARCYVVAKVYKILYM